ncbi:AsmA-like C-terminal domain-containing protein [Geomonas nitrogeniifigens]|uniref:YhdP family protein n=1 Tax=Geomonas diazotrophica TaxID=2843197 RepID=UPI001C2C0450|nr:AsmA-like C-terminal domain-containing protein [Geomonas nitrogeniifigens]QXE85794.1 AsmA-like C-terminal domain-containing protein [Geomonas nitrogeniifigens]
MPLKKIRAWLLPLLATILTVVVLGVSLLPRLLDLDTYKSEILAQVKTSLKRDLQYQTGAFTMRLTPAFTFTGVTIKEKDGTTEFATADRLTVRIAILPLLRRELVLSRIELERPTLRLWRDRQGVLNIADLLTPSGGEAPGIRGVELKKAQIRFTDYAFAEQPLITELSDTDLFLSRITRGRDCDFKLDGQLLSGRSKVPIHLSGVAGIPAAGAPLAAMPVHGKIKTGPIDVGHFWPYYSRFVPFKSLSGQLELEASLKGHLNAFKGKTEFRFTRMNLDYPQVFHARLTPKSFKGSCSLELTERNLEIDHVKADLDGFKVNGKVKLSDLHSGDLRITASASSNSFNLRDYRQYIPYGIIVDDTAHFIEQKITGGVYRLDQGRLDGRVSQILHMERGQNYNVLYIKAHVEEGVVNYGSGIPVFSGIKGQLELAGKDFFLKGMTGRFGTSPLALEGRITDYPLDHPCQYPFTAKVQPRQPEVVWLLGKGIGSFTTNSILNLKGEGGTALYRLSGDSDLTTASYSFKDLVAKPAGRTNSVSFSMDFDKEQFRITSLHYQLPPASLSATAVSRYDGPVTFEIRTNPFQSTEVGQLVPMVKKYHPTGVVQLLLHAGGPDMDRLTWSGNVGLSGVTLKPGEKIKPLTGVNGTVKVNGETFETSQLQVRLGSTSISGRGVLTGLQNPSWQLVFSSPSVDPADIGFANGGAPVRVERVQGNLTYQKDNLQITSLSGSLGKTSLQVKGSVKDLQHPLAELVVAASYLNPDDLMPLFGGPGGENHLTLRAHLTAAEGKLKDFPFQHLRTSVFYENHVLQLLPFEFSSFEGEVTGRLRSDLAAPARHTLSCTVQKVSAAALLHSLGVKKQEVTGAMSLQGDLAVRGESAADFKRSIQGNVKLRIERGSIRKFSTLSKIFSILNVSQLFKGQLPDMVSGGMPFNKITGDIAFNNGVATTQNLFVDSNAMNISAVGKVDLVKDELDLNVGVQPLQTVDKVVSKIPIFGWILTGKDKSLITTYFEAKGHIEDPQVTAVPVKSLAKGVFNIFKRVFELPARLITDTGEVIIGR